MQNLEKVFRKEISVQPPQKTPSNMFLMPELFFRTKSSVKEKTMEKLLLVTLNPLPDDWSKLRQIADDILKCI